MSEIKSQPASAAYREAWERIFGEKEEEDPCATCETDCAWCEDCEEQSEDE